MLLLTAAKGVGAGGGWGGVDAGWSILTQHQHKHTEDKGRRGEERHRGGGGRYIRHHSSTAAPVDRQDKTVIRL